MYPQSMFRFFQSVSLRTTFASSLFQTMYKPSKPLPLGRWCHESSDVYKHTCKPNKKADLANMDNSFNHK